jgi:hypothetical protein
MLYKLQVIIQVLHHKTLISVRISHRYFQSRHSTFTKYSHEYPAALHCSSPRWLSYAHIRLSTSADLDITAKEFLCNGRSACSTQTGAQLLDCTFFCFDISAKWVFSQRGKASAGPYTCDIGDNYVRFNQRQRSSPLRRMISNVSFCSGFPTTRCGEVVW